jgi:hypothetical protein
MTDEELSISDATLIARLRESQSYEWQDPIWETRLAAADRIEQLAVTNEQLVATNEALTAKLATCEKYRDAYAECDRIGTQAVRDLEAKLAAAEAEAKKYKHAFAAQSRKLQAVLHIEGVKATLAEIKGESHE